MEKRLIQKVCEHDLLYAVDTAHYRDRAMRAVAWSDIGKDLGIPASQCKDMWRKLRNCYLNAINRRQNKNIPKWKYEDEMSFLLPFIEIKAPDNDVEILTQSPTLNYHEVNADALIEDSSEMILPETSTFLPKKERPDDDATEDMALSIRKRSGFYRPAPSYDETEMFFVSISETVKRLPAMDQARIKMEICKLVYMAEIRQLEGDY